MRAAKALTICIALTALLWAPRGIGADSFSGSPAAETGLNRGSADSITLDPGSSVSRKLNGAGKHEYRVNSVAGKTARFVVEQNGIDVMVALKTADGRVVKKTDRPSGAFGPETVTYNAADTETLTLEITAFIPDAVDGGYEIRYLSLSETTGPDLIRSNAEDLTSAAEETRGKGTRESRLLAIEQFEKGLGEWERLGDTFEQAVVLYGIGFTNYNLSNHHSAALAYSKALKMHSANGFPFGRAVNHSALGAVQYSIGEYDLAIHNYSRAIAIYRELGNARGLGIAFHGLGTAQMLRELYGDASESFEQSRIWRDRANDNSGRILTGLSLVNLKLLTADTAAAEAEIIKVSSYLGPNRVDSNPEYQYYLGRVHLSLKRYADAERSLSAALQLFERAGNRLRRAQTLFELSRVSFAQDRIEKSLTEIRTAASKIEELRSATPNYRSRIGFTEIVKPFFDQHVRVLAALHDRDAESGYDLVAFEIAEQARARGLLDRLERRSLIRRRVLDPVLLERENVLRDRIARILELAPAKRSAEDLAELQELGTEFAEVEIAVNSQLDVPESKQIQTMSVEELRKTLTPDVAVIAYAFAGDTVISWLVTSGSVSMRRAGSVSDARTLSEKAFGCFSAAPARGSRTDCRAESVAIGKMMLGDFGRRIADKKLLVIKHDAFESVPMAALVNPATGKYLIETNEVLKLPSASILSVLKTPAASTAKTLAVFADPVYSPDDSRIAPAARRTPSDRERFLRRLFASRIEAQRISDLVPGGDAVVNMDFSASRENFFGVNLSNFRLIHFAAHALIDPTNPDASSIMLSEFDGSATSMSGAVRYNDIQRLDLNAELVVLSACQSGIGRQVRGEGFASLAQGFFSVGAKKVMFSRWEVDDKVTAETMVRFYRKLISEKLPPSTAARQAQVSLLSDPRWRHPYYWAAFTIQGSY